LTAQKLNTPHGFRSPLIFEVALDNDIKNLAYKNLIIDNSTVGKWIEFHLQNWVHQTEGEVDCRIDGEPFRASFCIHSGMLSILFEPLQSQLNSHPENQACILTLPNGLVIFYQNEGFPQLPFFENSKDWFYQPIENILKGNANISQLAVTCNDVLKENTTIIRLPVKFAENKKCSLDSFEILDTHFSYRAFIFEYQPTQNDFDTQLNIQEKKFNRILDHFQLGLLEVGEDGLIKKVNPSFCRMSGYTVSELLGRDPSALLLDEDNKAMMSEINQRRQEGYAGAYELKIKTKKGDSRWWLISGAPNIDNDGNDHGSIGIHWDISKQKELELNLVRDKNKAEAIADFKTQFLANMSHEIRTPLNAIVGMIRELKLIANSPEQKEYINIANIASEALLNIINDVLDYSKLEAGKISLEHITFNPLSVAKNAALLISDRIREKKLEFELIGDTDESNLYFGDPNRLQQSLLNILSNAAKFTQVGKITLIYQVLPTSENKILLEYTIVDTGVGMDPNYLNRVFDKFSQADESISRKYGGSGLGLSITKSLIEMMGGNVEIESQKHIGTTVKLTVPVQKSNESTNEKIAALDLKNPQIANMKVLVVEDNALNRAVAQAFLKRHRIHVTEAIDGLHALEIVDKDRFDLILMDIQMPTIDGIEVCAIMRSKGIQTPIVALTANAQHSEKTKCVNAGMDGYLVKPFNENELIETLIKYNHSQASIIPQNHQSANLEDHDSPSFGLERIKDLVGDDETIVNSIVELFVREGAKIATVLENAINGHDIKMIRAKLHELRPNLHNMGMDDALAQLEDFRNYIVEDRLLPQGSISGLELVNKMRKGIDEMSIYLENQ
jgi:PAS domain S-box-containing protein